MAPPPKAAPPPARLAKAKKGGSVWSYVVIYVVFGLSALAAGISLYDALFPVRPTAIGKGDTARLNALFYSGAPAVWMCTNATFQERPTKTLETAFAQHLQKDGIAAYTLDCAAPLKKDAPSAVAKFKLQADYNPMWGIVAYGKKPVQISPGFTGNPAEFAVEAKRLIGENRVMKVGNRLDLAACLKDRTGGCLIVYTGRSHAELTAQLAPLLPLAPTTKFASVNSSFLKLASAGGAGTALARVLAHGVGVARDAAAAAEVRGELLVLARRVSVAGAGSTLVTVGFTAAPGVVAAADVNGLVAKSKKAAELAARGAGAAPASDDALDALLAREEALEAAHSALVGLSGDFTLDSAAPPAPKRKTTPLGAGAAGGAAGGADADKAERIAAHRRRQAGSSGSGAAAGGAADGGDGEPADGLTPAERRAQAERRQREAMAAEEAASAFVAHAAADSEEDEEGGGGGAGSEGEGAGAASGGGSSSGGGAEEEVVDLDSDSEHEHGGGVEGEL
jgi:hypothetical protein